MTEQRKEEIGEMVAAGVRPPVAGGAGSMVRRRGGFVGDFWEGVVTPWRGFVYMLGKPGLWTFGWAPVLINLAVTTLTLMGLAVGLYYGIGAIHGSVYFASGWWGRTQEVLVVMGLVVAALGMTLAVYFLLASALCGYFYGLLAKEVEKQLGMREEDMKELPLHYQVFDALRDFLVIGGTSVGCLLLGCVPVVGSVVGTGIALYVDCFVFGYDYLDFPLELRAMKRKEKWAFARRHRAHTVGLGLTVLVFNFVPILGSVMLTTAATGAVLLHRKLVEREEAERKRG